MATGVTRRDFEAVAAIIEHAWRDEMSDESENVLVDVSTGLADYFESQNERFKREQFLQACGLEVEVAE